MRANLAVMVLLASCSHSVQQQAVVLRPKPIVAPPDIAPLPNATLALGGDSASAETAPAPISGGTVLVSGTRAWVSGPDAGVVDVVDLETKKLARTFTLGKGSLPGRLAEASDGKVVVVLRGEGSIATLDFDAKTFSKRKVCPAPQ